MFGGLWGLGYPNFGVSDSKAIERCLSVLFSYQSLSRNHTFYFRGTIRFIDAVPAPAHRELLLFFCTDASYSERDLSENSRFC